MCERAGVGWGLGHATAAMPTPTRTGSLGRSSSRSWSGAAGRLLLLMLPKQVDLLLSLPRRLLLLLLPRHLIRCLPSHRCLALAHFHRVLPKLCLASQTRTSAQHAQHTAPHARRVLVEA